MLPERRRKTNVGVGIGFLLFVIGFVLSRQEDPTGSVGFLLMLVSVGPFTWGCMNYAEGKGHSKWVGLVGVAGIIGLIILIVLPDQHKNGR
jgi:drug/metabolite transporter (DMT)-like permease